MTVTAEELMAYADGELSSEEAQRIARAIAADPDLAARLEAQRSLRATLKNTLDPVAQEPVPDALAAMIAAADENASARQDPTSARPAPVLDFAAAKARREAERKAKAKTKKAKVRTQSALPKGQKGVPLFARPGLAAGLAAALVMGVMIGLNLGSGRLTGSGAIDDSSVLESAGQLIARGALAQGLDTQLASAQKNDGPLRILTSFKRADGSYCRAYATKGNAGIACHEGGNWVLERTLATPRSSATALPGGSAYRQAGSPEAELMIAAQNMANGAPLDAKAEAQARENGW